VRDEGTPALWGHFPASSWNAAWAAVHAASVVLEVAPGETMDALVRHCVPHLWPEEASS
jgi:hypothetical protein